MPYNDEKQFEEDLIKYLINNCGWKDGVIEYPDEQVLIDNWAQILFENNSDVDHLNNYKLTKGEMRQIINQIQDLKSPFELNRSFINAKCVTIIRDNPDDVAHFNLPVALKIYDKKEIASGKSRYQIARQPKFKTNNSVYPTRRGDLMLLINGMPVYHIELKKSSVDISHAERQIEKYMINNVFTGIFSLVQIFVAMNPEEAVYYANPGPDGRFNPLYYFHWTDTQNNYVNEWDKFAHLFLMIPRAHEIIGFYTVPDASDGVLKVLRPYQIYAAENIFNKVSSSHWTKSEQKAGYIWHTTGSGKTLTSFKTAQLIATMGIADKVVFLIDRVELGEQSYFDYVSFANVDDCIYDTSNTISLINLLKSDEPDEKVIITSIQKMSRIKANEVPKSVIEKIKSKRVVFIIDECHRDQSGEMHQTIEYTFPNAMFFGFTGTPDHEKTTDIFGNELHRYTIAHAVRELDQNVLGFDCYKVSVYDELKCRQIVGLKMSNSLSEDEAMSDPAKSEIYMYFLNKGTEKCSMIEVEKHLPKSQFETNEYRQNVVNDIINKWKIRSLNSLFHAIFATSSIHEAIEYYKIFSALKKEGKHKLNVTAIFDPSDNNEQTSISKMDGITQILTDYKEMFGNTYDHAHYDGFKKDACLRLAHKEPYQKIDKQNQIDIVIVVDQLLTGFDSKWINTVYLDKKLVGKNFIQAASRTNRLFGPEKKHGTIVWYRYPYTTEQLFYEAIKEYSGDCQFGVYVDKLEKNLKCMNDLFDEIYEHFKMYGIMNFEKNMEDIEWKKKFARLFKKFNDKLDSAKLQGFFWGKYLYTFDHDDMTKTEIEIKISEHEYCALLQRYSELFQPGPIEWEPPFAIDTHIVELQSAFIDSNYMNSRFKQFIKDLNKGDQAAKMKALSDLHESFASLSEENQIFAKQFLNDLENGLEIDSSKEFTDYLADYRTRAYDDEIHHIACGLGINEIALKELINLHPTEETINSFGKYRELSEEIDCEKARVFLKARLNRELSKKADIIAEADDYLRKIIINGL